MCLPGAHGGQMLDRAGLELQTVVIAHVGVGNLVLWQNGQCS